MNNEKDIRELQRLAEQGLAEQGLAKRAPARPRQTRRSRAARLESIDLLSRWSAAGLALLAGIGIYLSIAVGREYPTRAAAWALMLLAALWVSRTLQAQFRAGAAIAAHPFRWRATFTSCLCVLGVAFASAPILLSPLSGAPALVGQVGALTLFGGFGAAIFFSAHANSAAAVAIPTAAFSLLAAWRNGDVMAGVYAGVAALIGGAVIAVARYAIAQRLRDKHPRTTLLRQSADAPISSEAENAGRWNRQTA